VKDKKKQKSRRWIWALVAVVVIGTAVYFVGLPALLGERAQAESLPQADEGSACDGNRRQG